MEIIRIQKIKQDIEAQIKKGFSGKEDKNLAEMAEMPGWDVLNALLNSLILKMIQPISPDEAQKIGNLEMIGAMGIARGLVADTLGSVISLVEGTRDSIRTEREKKESEELENEEENV